MADDARKWATGMVEDMPEAPGGLIARQARRMRDAMMVVDVAVGETGAWRSHLALVAAVYSDIREEG